MPRWCMSSLTVGAGVHVQDNTYQLSSDSYASSHWAISVNEVRHPYLMKVEEEEHAQVVHELINSRCWGTCSG